MGKPENDPVDRTWALRGPVAQGEPVHHAESAGLAILILIAHPDNECLGSRTRLEIGSAVTIGRDPACEIAFSEVPSLSRLHARVRFSDNGVVVEDLGSTNGSFVNDRRVTAAVGLSSGDRIQFGALHFKFDREDEVEASYHEAIHLLVLEDGV
mgnify:FL=1